MKLMKGFLSLALWASVSVLFAQTVAFPGAEGYGKIATGGRGGKVVKVTNLDDLSRSGQAVPGSFRAALAQANGDEPVTIVFEISGIIELANELRAKVKDLTIAGQTAPGEGICIKNYTVNLGGSENVIIRYIRFRPGDTGGSETSALRFENAKNIIVDHCSMSWAVEEIMGVYDNVNTTVQWCILSEGLYESLHKKGARGYASQWGGQYASYHHNLLAHNRSRSPRINGSQSNDTIALLDVRNNVIFNWGSDGAVYGGEEAIAEGKCETNFVNNYYIPGEMTPSNLLFARPSYKRENVPATGYAGWYFSGNYMEGVEGGMNDDNWEGVSIIGEIGSADNIRSETEFEVSPVTTQSASEAKDLVFEGAGAILPVRDDVDVRIVGEAKGEMEVQGSGRIDSQSEVGGWPEYQVLGALPDTDGDGMPDEYESANSLDPNSGSDGSEIQSDGYSNLEHYINSLSGITGVGEIIDPLNVDNVSSFEIYPNPTNGRLYFRHQQRVDSIRVYDLSGKQMKAISNGENKGFIDLDGLNEGVYLLKVKFQNGKIIERKVTLK